MSLATPERIRSLQRKLYCTAKAKPAFRFYTLYDKICRADVLAHAYEVARSLGEGRGASRRRGVTEKGGDFGVHIRLCASAMPVMAGLSSGRFPASPIRSTAEAKRLAPVERSAAQATRPDLD